jgi:hypothetical protein
MLKLLPSQKKISDSSPNPANFNRTWYNIALVVILYFFVSILFRPVSLLGDLSSGDDTSYISHAFTIALDFDFDYTNEPISEVGGHWTPSKTAPAHPIGPGLMAAPVVLALSVLDRIAESPVISDHKKYHQSWSLFGFFIAASLWFWIGLWLYFDSLDSIGARFSRWTILLFASSAGVAYYVLTRPIMGHAFEFSSAAMVLWGSVKIVTCGTRGRALYGVILVAGILLTLLVRPSNFNIFLLPPATWGLLKLCGYIAWRRKNLGFDVLVFGISFVTAALIFVAINQALYGHPLPGISATYGTQIGELVVPDGFIAMIFALLQGLPSIWPLLFGSEFGLFFSAPILPAGYLAILALLTLHGKKMPVLFCSTVTIVLLYFALPIAIIIILRAVGGAVGVRYLFSLLPLSILGIVLLLNEVSGRITGFTRITVVVLSFWGLIGQAFADTGPDLMSKPAVNSLGRYDVFARVGYQIFLAEAVVSPKAWLNVAARRFPGFVGVKLLENPIRPPASQLEKLAASIRLIKMSSPYYFGAIVLFWMLYPICLAWLCIGFFRRRL